jgi:hypothetical protein
MIDGKYHVKSKIASISSGTSLGHCIGYCRRSVIDNNKNKEIEIPFSSSVKITISNKTNIRSFI